MSRKDDLEPLGAQFGQEFGEVFEYSASSLWLIWPHRFWKPGRGQNTTDSKL